VPQPSAIVAWKASRRVSALSLRFEREMWIAKNGSLVYWSKKEAIFIVRKPGSSPTQLRLLTDLAAACSCSCSSSALACRIATWSTTPPKLGRRVSRSAGARGGFFLGAGALLAAARSARLSGRVETSVHDSGRRRPSDLLGCRGIKRETSKPHDSTTRCRSPARCLQMFSGLAEAFAQSPLKGEEHCGAQCAASSRQVGDESASQRRRGVRESAQNKRAHGHGHGQTPGLLCAALRRFLLRMISHARPSR